MKSRYTRADDERLLAMVSARSRGMTTVWLAERFLISQAGASQLTNAVREQDVATADTAATPEQIRKCYWK